MKPTAPLLLAVVVVATSVLSAAGARAAERLTPEDFINLLRIDLRAQKAEVVASALEMTPEEAKIFWPIYREYDATLSKLNVARVGVLRDFAMNYGSIDDAKARELSRRTFDFTKRRLALLEKTSLRLEKALSAAFAARWAQLENQLTMMVDLQLASEMPLIPRQAVVSKLP